MDGSRNRVDTDMAPVDGMKAIAVGCPEFLDDQEAANSELTDANGWHATAGDP